MPTVVLLGTLDTKGREYAFLRDRISVAGDEETVRLLAEHVLPVAADAGRETMGANVTT